MITLSRSLLFTEIQAFEDFIIESTPVFKRVGVGELLYSRRYPDREEARIGRDMCVRTVVYRVFLQKIRKVEKTLLEQICVEARVWLNEPVIVDVNGFPSDLNYPSNQDFPENLQVSLNIIDELQQATQNQ